MIRIHAYFDAVKILSVCCNIRLLQYSFAILPLITVNTALQMLEIMNFI